MVTRSLMDRASHTKRRNAIILFVITILVLGVVSGIGGSYITDNTVYSAGVGETIVTEAALPEDGTPDDYDAISNLQYAAYKLHHSAFFRGETDGVAVADIGFTTYAQHLRNTRVVLGETKVFAETVSSSSLKNLGEQKYADGDIVIYRPSVKVKDGVATFSDTAYPMTYENYANNYGTIPNQLSKYIINEKTIIAVKDENAPVVMSAKNSPAGGEEGDGMGIDYYVPENLVAGEDGHYVFTLTLDPDTSSRYYRNEVRTLAGADQNPRFYSVYVTIEIDAEWNPIKVTTVETYDIAIPVLGAMTCTGTNVETFYQLDDANGELPYTDFFGPYVDAVKLNPDYRPQVPPTQTASPADYLASAFADYINGETPLVLDIDVVSDVVSAYGIKLSANLDTLEIQAMLDNLYVKYEGDKVYVQLNNINGYMTTADFTELAKNDKVAALMAGFGGIADLDMQSLFGGDMLDTVFGKCEMTTEKGVTRLHLPFELNLAPLGIDGKAEIDASIYVNDETMSLVSISGDINVLGVKLSVSAKPPRRAPRFPSTNGAKDISGILDFIPDIIATAEQKTFGIDGTVSAMGFDLGINGYIDIQDGIKADAVLSVLGADVSVKYADDIIYLTVGGIDVRGTVEELPVLIDAVKPLIGDVDMSKYLDMIKLVMPTTASDFVNMVKSLTVNDDTLTLKLNALTVPITVSLLRADGRISGVGVEVAMDSFGIKLDGAASLNLTYPEAREIVLPTGDEYITFTQLAELIAAAEPYVSASGYDVKLNATVTIDGTCYDVAASVALDTAGEVIQAAGSIDLFGQTAYVTYVDGIVYMSLGNIRVMLDTQELNSLTTPLSRMIDLPSQMPSQLDIAALLSTVDYITVKDDTLIAALNINSETLDATINLATGEVTLNGSVQGVAIDLSATVIPTAEIHEITAPNGGNGYVPVNELGVTIDAIADILQAKGFTATATVNAAENSFTVGLDVNFANGLLKMHAVEKSMGLEVTLIGGDVYISLGDVRVTGKLAEIPALMVALEDVIPEDVMNAVNGMLGDSQAPVDIASTVGSVVEAITQFTHADGMLGVSIDYNGIGVALDIATNLSGMTVTANVNGTDISATVYEVTAASPEISVSGDYAQLSDFIALASPIVPLIDAQAFDLNIDATLFGTTVQGNIYVFLGGASTPFAVDAKLALGDVPVTITVKDGMLYLSVANTLHVSEQLTEAALMDAVDKLDYALPGIKATVEEIIEQIKAMTLEKLLGCVALYPAEDGFNVVLDMNKLGMDMRVALGMSMTDGAWSGVTIDCGFSDTALNVTLDTVIENDTLTGFTGVTAEDGIFKSLAVTLEKSGYREVKVNEQSYVPLTDITRLIAPIFDIVEKAETAKAITLELSAQLITPNNAYTSITGSVVLSLNPLAVDLTLTLFAGTADATEINVVYTCGTVYVKAGNIGLSLDTTNDFERLYNVLAEYLPAYINHEIAKLFGLEQGASAFSDISLLIDRFVAISKANDTAEIFELLFAPLEGIHSASAIGTVLDMVAVFEREASVTVGLNVLGITLNLTPAFDGEYQELIGAALDTNVMGYSVKFDVTGFNICSAETNVNPPANAAEYVSVIEFVEAVNNAVHTFTQKDDDGNITFELTTFNFDYKIFAVETTTDETGNVVNVKDDAGRDKPLYDENGNKVVDKTIKVYNKQGYSALKGKFIRSETTDDNGEVTAVDYKFNLEAHVVLDISSLKNSSPLTLDLYVVNTDGNGIAFLDYMEGNGYGERISIDYKSIMQILAAVLDIMGVDDEISEMLLGDYRLNIDKTVFDSMDIAGLDSIKQMLADLVKAARDAKDAIDHVKTAWDLIATAESINGLNARLDDIKDTLALAIDKLKSALSVLGSNSDDEPEEDAEPTEPESAEINGKLFNQIVNGVTFKKDETHIWATIDNELTTGTDGISAVAVTQDGGKIRSINVNGLDVNTAKLENFDARFTAGEPITVELPSDYNATKGNATYSDFSNIRHILFDVMNTANMLEFDIGGLQTSDEISVHMSLGSDWLASIPLTIKYDVKVKIIKVGEKPDGKPIYKTAAAVELFNNKAQLKIVGIGSKVIVPECTTRLFFYDDVLYVQGISDWQSSTQNKVVGTITDITCIADVWGSKQTRYPKVTNTAYKQETTYNMNYVQVMYTVDELFWMIKNDMNRFLNEFLFYLIPLTTEKIAGQDIRALISNNIGGSSGSKENPQKTVAQIFKGYTYNNGAHSFKIGLAELAGSSSLGDLNISLVGVNDNDDNILDNYISSLSVSTSIANIIDVNLNATLRNVEVSSHGISSKGLAPTNVTQEVGKYSANGKNYMFDCINYDRNTIYTLDGLTYLTANGNDLYTENGSFAPALCPTDGSDVFVWTSTAANTDYCETVYKFGDTGATYYYTTSLAGYGHRIESSRDTYYIGIATDGSKYVYRIENGNQVHVSVRSITDSFLAKVARDANGNIVSVTNRSGAPVWNRIWQSAYEAAQ